MFFFIASSIYFGMHLLVYRGLRQVLPHKDSARRLLFRVFWLLGFIFFVNLLLRRSFHAHFFSLMAYLWMGLIVSAFFLFLLWWPPTLFFPRHKRRLAWAALGAAVFIYVYSLYMGLSLPIVRQFDIPLAKLPSALAGFRIVQLSDLHFEGNDSNGRAAEIVTKVNALKPDLIVITGDLIEGPVTPDGGLIEILKQLHAPQGVLVVSGNHDYYAGITFFDALTRAAGMRVLHDEITTVAGGLEIIGLDDESGRGAGNSLRSALNRVLLSSDPAKPRILLYHRPTIFDEAAEKGIDFEMSGHTHGGQFFPVYWLVKAIYKYPWGLYQKGSAWIYTSCGTGLWGPPLRFPSRNEIVLFTLVGQTTAEKH